MKRLLLLTITILVAVTPLLMRPAQTQEPDEVRLPTPADYPEAEPNCKYKVQMSPWVGTPAVQFTETVKCVLDINTCDGVKTFTSGVRKVGENVCADFWRAHSALATREICCEKKNCKPPNLGSVPPPWFDRSKPCRRVQRGNISWAQTRRSNRDLSYTVNVCGQVIRFIQEGMGPAERQPPGVKTFQVCCEKWQSSAATTPPCDRSKDIDCDGTMNETDSEPVSASYDDLMAEDFVINQPIAMAVPFWKDILPPGQAGCPECQWELVELEFDCENLVQRTGRRRETNHARYSYKGTWRCPMTGNLQKQDRVVTMWDVRCPTSAGRRHWP